MAMTHQYGNRLFLNEKGGHRAEKGRALRKGGEKQRGMCHGGGWAIAAGEGNGASAIPGPAAWPHQHGETALCRGCDTKGSWEKISKADLILQVCEVK